MTERPPKDLAASVRQRLLNWSQREQFDFQYVLTRYGIERLLYRLGRSPFSDHFVLKGAMLFVAWEGWSPRPTRDVDLLGRGEHNADQLRSVFEAICRLEVEPDGLVFHPDTVKVTDIREDQAYGGRRVQLRASLGLARIHVQVDIGYGDAILPPPARLTFPTLLDLPAPTILAYARETVVAEKYHALVTLGLANSRMEVWMPVYIGIDWSQTKHDVCYLNETGAPIARQVVAHSPEGFQKLDAQRQQLGLAPDACLVGIESAHNLLIDFLWGHGYHQVFVIAPNVVNSTRGRDRQSGARTDQSDAFVLADSLRTDRARL